MKLIIFLVICSLLLSCNDDRSIGPDIQMRNNSKLRSVCRISEYFPDTTARNSASTGCSNVDDGGQCSFSSEIIGGSWKDRFEENGAGKLVFFIFDRAAVTTYGEEAVFSDESRILKKYILPSTPWRS